METDPKGQLGGLDTSEAVRKRLAGESRAWRCSGCGGRTNEEIIKECEDAAKAAEQEEEAAGGGSSSSAIKKSNEVEIPAELKLGFRDEMEKAAAAAAAAAAERGSEAAAVAAGVVGADDAESAELAEGFVQTVPREALEHTQTQPQPPAAGAARPGQTVPQPTRTIPLPNAAPNLAQAPLQQRQTFNDNGGVPRWIDRVIAALVVCLIGMILKVLLAKQ